MNTKHKKPGRLRSAVLNWLGFGLADVEQWESWFGSKSSAGVNVTVDKALTLSSVWACTRIVAQTIATLPVGLYERKADGSRELADNLQVARLIHSKPNADMSAVVFWESIISNAMLQGNGFAEKKKIGSRIVSLEFMRSAWITWAERKSGGYEFYYQEPGKARRTLQEEDVFHIPGFTMSGKFGMSVIKYGAEVFGSALAGNNAASATFKNGLMPTTYFKMEQVLKKEQREEFRESMKGISGAINAGKSPLLEGGMDVGLIGINPDDAQLLESRSFSIEEICRWFGVPPSMIGATDKASSWASSSEQLNIWFLQYGLRPWLKRIEQTIWDSLLTPVEQMKYYAEFAVEGLLRADTSARKDFYASALQNGYMNRSTVAKLENLPAIPGGDTFTVQSNLVPLDQLGSGTDSQAVRAALQHWLREGEQ